MTPASDKPSPWPQILVVEDDDGVRGLLEIALSTCGFDVHLTKNGSEAVEVYRRHRDSIGMVLLDVQMPGLDGPQAFAALRLVNPAVRCCFMSGDTGRYSTPELLGMGAIHVFSKPFSSLAELAKTLEQLTGEGSRASG